MNGKKIAMIFQDPLAHLHPLYTIGHQITEALRAHESIGAAEAWAQAVRLLERVGIPDAERRARQYPHQFSGGQRQRVMIAMALAMKPELLIADEPTTALDVTIQAQILRLLRDLCADLGMGLILITHDLAVAAHMGDRVAVMQKGRDRRDRADARRVRGATACLYAPAARRRGEPRRRRRGPAAKRAEPLLRVDGPRQGLPRSGRLRPQRRSIHAVTGVELPGAQGRDAGHRRRIRLRQVHRRQAADAAGGADRGRAPPIAAPTSSPCRGRSC